MPNPKRRKVAQHRLKFFLKNFHLSPPIKVLLEPSFYSECVARDIQISYRLVQLCSFKVKPFLTNCAVHHLHHTKQENPQLQKILFNACKKFPRYACNHTPALSPDKCLIDCIKAQPAAIASHDKEFSVKLNQQYGEIPVIYFNKDFNMNIAQISDLSKKKAEESHTQQLTQQKRDWEFQLRQQKRREQALQSKLLEGSQSPEPETEQNAPDPDKERLSNDDSPAGVVDDCLTKGNSRTDRKAHVGSRGDRNNTNTGGLHKKNDDHHPNNNNYRQNNTRVFNKNNNGEFNNRNRNYDNQNKNYDNQSKNYDNQSKNYDNQSKNYDQRSNRNYDNQNKNYDQRNNRNYDNQSKNYDNQNKNYDQRNNRNFLKTDKKSTDTRDPAQRPFNPMMKTKFPQNTARGSSEEGFKKRAKVERED